MTEKTLALDGGAPVNTEDWPAMFHGPAAIGEEEVAAVSEVLRSQKLFRFLDPKNSRCAKLEAQFREMTGCQYALAVGGGTASLICALTGLGIGDGDEVIIPAYTYIATAAAVVVCGAVPVIAEIDESLTLDPAAIEPLITERTRAIIPVHMRGYPCDMDPILEVAKKHDLLVLEDTAQACGGSYKGRRLGSLGDAGCFSLQQYKIITAGEGGIVVTGDRAVYARAALRHDSAMHFWDRDTSGTAPFAGGNFRMNEMAGALGSVQFERLDSILGRCRELTARIRAGVADAPGVSLHQPADPEGECGISVALMFADGETARHFAEALRAEHIPCGSLYDKGIPDRHVFCYWDYIMEKTSQDRHGWPWTSARHDSARHYTKGMCPRTLDILGRAILLPVFQTYEDRHADMMVEGVQKVARALS
jgi:8-amino-3,8-dideoxy-alpha-D-manno-octulosonate transaminase